MRGELLGVKFSRAMVYKRTALFTFGLERTYKRRARLLNILHY